MSTDSDHLVQLIKRSATDEVTTLLADIHLFFPTISETQRKVLHHKLIAAFCAGGKYGATLMSQRALNIITETEETSCQG